MAAYYSMLLPLKQHAWTVEEAVAWLPKEFGLEEDSLASNQVR